MAIFYVNVLHKITNQINDSNVLLKWPIGECIWRNSNLVAEGFRICLNKCISNEIPYSCVDLNSNDDNHISRVFKSSQLYRCHCFSSHHADYSSKKHLKDSSRKIIRNCFAIIIIIIIIIANYWPLFCIELRGWKNTKWHTIDYYLASLTHSLELVMTSNGLREKISRKPLTIFACYKQIKRLIAWWHLFNRNNLACRNQLNTYAIPIPNQIIRSKTDNFVLLLLLFLVFGSDLWSLAYQITSTI